MLARGRLGDLRGWLLRPATLSGRALLLLVALALLRGLALHVDAAAEVGALGNRDARRDDIAVYRTAVPDFHLLGGIHVAVHLAKHDQRLGKHLRLDLPV